MGRNAHVRIPAEPPRADLLALEKDLVGPSRARDILSSIGWLSRQPESFQDEVFRRLVPVRYAAGDIIYRQGDPLGGIYGVVSGTVIASVAPGKSVPHILHILTPRGWTGEGSFLSREPRRIELRAALALSGVRQAPEAGLHVVQQVFGLAGGRDGTGDVRVRDDEFEDALRPALSAGF